MRLKMKFAFAVAAAILACASASVHAQSPIIAILGSSAQWLELGQASSLITPPGGGSMCVWDSGSTKFTITDERTIAGGPYTDTGATWIAWSTGTGANCQAPAGTWEIILFANTDSVVGNRCFFANPSCHIVTGLSGTANVNSASTLTGISETALPPAVFNAINNTSGSPVGVPITAAATDIRPEDAKFAINRALTPCGQPIQDTAIVNVSGSETPVTVNTQYLGIGDQTATAGVGNKIAEGQNSTTKFNVLNFNIVGNDPFSSNPVQAYSVTELGAVPVVVFVNPGNSGGFGSLQLSNIDRAVLAGYLDGTYGSTSDAFLNQSGATPPSGSHVFVREYMSGTYNTMEYSIPNSVQVHSSQEVGLNAQLANSNGFIFPPYNCTGATVGGGPTFGLSANAASGSIANPLYEVYNRTSETSIRGREIGTGDEIKAVLAGASGLGTCTTCTPNQPAISGIDSLGYAFWGAANFVNAKAATGKYLTVDGIDPLEQDWQDGLIPNSAYDNLGDVSLAHVKDGTYPVYSILRLASNSASTSTITALVTKAIAFLGPTQPDFVHVTQLPLVRSHFAPPGVTFPSSNGTCTPVLGTSNCSTFAANGTGSNTEAGGDVGGLALTLQSEFDYITDTNNQNGNTGMRQ